MTLQHIHNKKSIKPICQIIFNNYVDLIAVRLDNYGVGPLIIQELIITDGNKKGAILLYFMPDEVQIWSNFVKDISERVIPIDGKIELLKLESSNELWKRKVREALSKLRITVKYKDIYGSKFVATRDLSFFGENSGKM
jgi:hypothetical protein